MFKKEYEKFIQEWLVGNKGDVTDHSGVTSKVIVNSLTTQPKPLKSLFFQPYNSYIDPIFRASTVVLAPVVYLVNTMLSAALAVGYVFKSIIVLAMLGPAEALKDAKKSMIALLSMTVAALATIVSPILNFVDLIGGGLMTLINIDRNLPSRRSLEAEHTRLLRENKRFVGLTKEFRLQNQDMMNGLEHASDPRYIPSDETPDEFICPITAQIMRQPILIEPGRSYEYLAIKRWYDLGHNESPMTRQPLTDPSIIGINGDLRIQIAGYIIARSPIIAGASSNVTLG